MSNRAHQRTVTVLNPEGLHARPAHLIVNVAQMYDAQIRIIRNGEAADGKSILSLLTLAAAQGTELRLEATGEDARPALDAIEKLFRSGFEVQDRDPVDDGPEENHGDAEQNVDAESGVSSEPELGAKRPRPESNARRGSPGETS